VIVGLDTFIREYAESILEDASRTLLEDLVEDAPVDTGELRDSAYGPDIDELTARIGFTAPQADYTDLGTPPHQIVPVYASALRFFWENGPRGADWYTYAEVNHPGQEGTGWFSDRIEEWDTYVQEAIEVVE
jgi:hypothetical protein